MTEQHGNSRFTQDIVDEICRRIASGESLRSICADKSGGWMPSKQCVLKWLNDPEKVDFVAQYTRAREAQADHFVEEIIEIADDATGDTRMVDGREVMNAEFVARARLRVDARKWVAGKLAPKKYGEKLAHTGADGESPVSVETKVNLSGLPDDVLKVISGLKLD